jgi:hypothetical protein
MSSPDYRSFTTKVPTRLSMTMLLDFPNSGKFLGWHEPPPLCSPAKETVSQPAQPLVVMLSKPKHLVFSGCFKDQILRL